MSSGYKPFPITEQKTGLYNYTQPWIRPQDAWEPLEDAYIYRGVLNKRDGYTELAPMAYRDNGVQVAVGNAGAAYAGNLATFPIRPGTLIIVAEPAVPGTLLIAVDNGLGQFIGNVVGPPSGVINYATGAWSLTFSGNVAAGVIIRAGYTYVPSQTTAPPAITYRPIMGLKNWIDERTDIDYFIALDTRRAAIYNIGTGNFDPMFGINQVIWTGDGTTAAIVIDTGFLNVAPYSIRVNDGVTFLRDDGLGNLVTLAGAALPAGNFTAGTIVYATGIISITFTVAPIAGAQIFMQAQTGGDYFTGNYTNFFNSTEWESRLYVTNNVDRITRITGNLLDRPPFGITLAHVNTYVNDITTALDVDVYKNRLLVQRPTVNGVIEAQSIRYSQINNPTNLAADISGNGGEISAPTEEYMQASEFLRDQLIVFFTNSTWIFRFTGSPLDPFRWDKLNISRSCNAPYGTIAYDDRVTAMGKKGLIYCDGTNVARYDINVPDLFLDINQTDFNLCYAKKFDTLNQSWMLFSYQGQVVPAQGTVISDRVIVYNFLENTWAVFRLAMSCLGTYYIQGDAVWADFAVGAKYWLDGYTAWELCDFSWDYWFTQDNSLSLMGGGHDNIVWIMNQGEFDKDVILVDINATSTRWNPFVKEGQKAQFGYLDIYYAKDDDTALTLTFYTDNSTAPAATRTFQLDGPANVDSAFKRVYLSITGEFLQMNITSANSGFKIYGIILWAKPAGRIFP